MNDHSTTNTIDYFSAFLQVFLQAILDLFELVSLFTKAKLGLNSFQQFDLTIFNRFCQVIKTLIYSDIPSTTDWASSISLRSSLEVCNFNIFWLVYCFCSHSSSLLSMFSIWQLKCSLSSSKNFVFLDFMVAMRSSKYFSDLLMTASAFSSRESLACRMSRRTDYVLSNLRRPSLAELLILFLRSLAPS